MFKRKRSRITCWLCGAVGLTMVGLAIYTYCHWSPGAPSYVSNSLQQVNLPYRLRNGPEHDAARQRNGGNPYILQVNSAGDGAILYYGASHTIATDHPQVADIVSRWNTFQPTVALCEGRSRGYFYGSLIEPFAGLPEPAIVHKLARRDDVRLYSLEPSYEAEVAELLTRFDSQQVALYFFLRVYISESQGVANEGLAADLLAKRTDVKGLRGSLPSLSAVDRVWERDYSRLENWRTLRTEPKQGYIASISAESRRIRGEHMLRTLIDLARQGERVFAVVGSGHVIRQEWNLRAVFGVEPAWDQPAHPNDESHGQQQHGRRFRHVNEIHIAQVATAR